MFGAEFVGDAVFAVDAEFHGLVNLGWGLFGWEISEEFSGADDDAGLQADDAGWCFSDATAMPAFPSHFQVIATDGWKQGVDGCHVDELLEQFPGFGLLVCGHIIRSGRGATGR
jgi:hypothetical protein